MADRELSDFNASSSITGYLFQVRYALLLLLEQDNPEALVSIEKFDDIAFEVGDNPAELLQTKHHTSRAGSLSDSSVDLWKTLRVWATAVKDRSVDLRSIIFTIVTTAQASEGSAASFLRSDSKREPEKALNLIQAAGASSKSKVVGDCYSALQDLSSSQQSALLSCIRVIDAAPNIRNARDLLEKKLRLSTRPQFLFSLCDRLEGWWFRSVIEHLTRPEEIKGISQRLVQVQLNDLQDQFREDNLSNDFPVLLDMDETSLSADDRVFVEQLKLLSIGSERIKRAISDYYRAFNQRSRWVREDLLLDQDLELYENRLMDEWRNLFLIMKEEVDRGADVVAAGRELYNELCYTSRHIPIRPSFPDPFVMRGSLHMLSNALKVGWHSEFETRLSHLLVRAVRAAA
jgi:hypothetical protein